jgi:nucleotide-binding universal stress UspA family protein
MKVFVTVADGGPCLGSVIDAGLQCAEFFDGQLKVVHVRDDNALLPSPALVAEMAYIPDYQTGAHTALRAELAARTWAQKSGRSTAGCFIDVAGDETEIILEHARLADISIIGRAGDDRDRPAPTYVNALLFGSGRPVLVVPPQLRPDWSQHVLIVWNRSPQASAAVAAALPLLRRAARVSVVSMGREGRRSPVAPLIEYLASHGIAATGSEHDASQFTARGRARAILKLVEESGAGMLVAGAYPSEVLSLFGLGRASEKLITSSKVPLLLAD